MHWLLQSCHRVVSLIMVSYRQQIVSNCKLRHMLQPIYRGCSDVDKQITLQFQCFENHLKNRNKIHIPITSVHIATTAIFAIATTATAIYK